MEQEAGLRSSLLGSGGRETDLCVSKKKTPAVGSLLTLCGSATARASEEDGEENSTSSEQDSALHHCPEIL